MIITCKRSLRPQIFSGLVVLVAIGAGLLRAPGATAQTPTPAPDPSDIADGMRLYQQKGDCQACHGWAGEAGWAVPILPPVPPTCPSCLSCPQFSANTNR